MAVTILAFFIYVSIFFILVFLFEPEVKFFILITNIVSLFIAYKIFEFSQSFPEYSIFIISITFALSLSILIPLFIKQKDELNFNMYIAFYVIVMITCFFVAKSCHHDISNFTGIK
jgi:hypothetical protein